jgi:hypothetical protein
MVYTLPQRGQPNASFGNQIGQSLSQGFQQSFQPAVQQQYQRGQLQQALSQLRAKSQDPNATPTDLLYNLIEASSYSPEIGRNLPALYAELNKAREANAMKNVNYGGEKPGFQPGGISRPSQPNNPKVEQAIQQNKFFPNNLGSQQGPGNFPQEATQGQFKPVLSGDQLLQKAQERQQQLANNGIVKSFEEVYNQVVNENEQNRLYNQNIEKETERRIAAQEKYGQLAETRLKKLIPDASDEESALFKKKGEDAAAENRSQGDIDRLISKEVSKYKNTLSNIEKNLEAPRIQNGLKKTLLGTRADMKSVEQDARAAVKPLIDLGLYEKARTMLANAGFYPEERETIIFGDMPKEIKSIVDSISKPEFQKKEPARITSIAGIPTGKSTALPQEYDLKSRVKLFENISNVWGGETNDKINLLQLRKAYEDKGYDWRIFKDAINELVNNGHIILNDDQQNIFNSYLNNPPLNNIEKILHGLGLRGR